MEWQANKNAFRCYISNYKALCLPSLNKLIFKSVWFLEKDVGRPGTSNSLEVITA